MEINQITGQIIDSAIKVHTVLGPGLLESAYEACLAYELHKRGVTAAKQLALPIEYDGVLIDAGYRIDLLVENRVIVELKAVEKMNPIFEAQLLSYLRLSNLQVGLLINFHVLRLKDGIKRIVNQYTGPTPRPSATSAVNPFKPPK
jgi:GxxExxY protein